MEVLARFALLIGKTIEESRGKYHVRSRCPERERRGTRDCDTCMQDPKVKVRDGVYDLILRPGTCLQSVIYGGSLDGRCIIKFA